MRDRRDGRTRRRIPVVDAGRPRNAPAAHTEGFLSRDGIPPAEFPAVAREEIARYGVPITDQVTEARGSWAPAP